MALRLLNADERVVAAVRSGEIGTLASGEWRADEGEPERAAPLSAAQEALLDAVDDARWRLSPNFHDALTASVYGVAERIAAPRS